MTLLEAVQMAYLKHHHLDDPTIGWKELSDALKSALCEEMGDFAFQEWLSAISPENYEEYEYE